MRKYAARKDKNQNQIARALQDVGYLVADTSRLGGGYPDLNVAGVCRKTGQRRVWLIEVKDKGGGLTPDEEQFHQTWAGYVHIVRSVDEAYRLVGVL